MWDFFKKNIVFFILVSLSGLYLVYVYAIFITDLILTDFNYWGFPEWFWWYHSKPLYFLVMIPLIVIISYCFLKGTFTIATNRTKAAIYLIIPLIIAVFFYFYIFFHRVG